MSKNKAYTHVSLFSGAGGLDIGLEQAGFHTVWANDFNHDACETHRLWSNATVVEGDIGKVDYDTIPDCDIASFGFPCQGFSLSGLRKIDDSRNVLYRHCVKLVEKKQPKLFLAENEFLSWVRQGGSDTLTEHKAPNNSAHLRKIMAALKDGQGKDDLPEELRPKSGFKNTYAKLWWKKPATTITRNIPNTATYSNTTTGSLTSCVNKWQIHLSKRRNYKMLITLGMNGHALNMNG